MKDDTQFYRLILECPYMEPGEDCVFNEYRKMSIAELIEKSRQLSTLEKREMLDRHEECFKKRKRQKLRAKPYRILSGSCAGNLS